MVQAAGCTLQAPGSPTGMSHVHCLALGAGRSRFPSRASRRGRSGVDVDGDALMHDARCAMRDPGRHDPGMRCAVSGVREAVVERRRRGGLRGRLNAN